MNEFNKLNWRPSSTDQLEQFTTFLTDEEASRSLVYKQFSDDSINEESEIDSDLEQDKYLKRIPGGTCFAYIPDKRSSLNRLQHENCLKAIKLIKNGIQYSAMTITQKYYVDRYNEYKTKIFNETQQYLKQVQQIWEKNKPKLLGIHNSLLTNGTDYWKENCKRYLNYDKYYKEITSFNMSYNIESEENEMNFECVEDLLQLGTVAKFCQPTFLARHILSTKELPNRNLLSNLGSKLPVSQDPNIYKLLDCHSIDIVISSSGLNQILDNTDLKSKWLIPVIVKYVNICNDEQNAVLKKVIFIDKPLPKTNPNYVDLKYVIYKQLLKANFCEYERHKYSEEDINIQPTEEDELENETSNENSGVKKKTNLRKLHHNVNYRIWKIKTTNQQHKLLKNKLKDNEIRLLVRNKIDGQNVEGECEPVVIKPKIEFQLKYGASVPSKTELSREWTALFFRPFSHLYRFRIDNNSSEIVSVEKCPMQKINTQAYTLYNKYRPIIGLNILQKLLEQLQGLDTGNYILQHLPKNEAFVAVLKACDEGTLNAYNLHSEYENFQIDDGFIPNWLPIDHNYILPINEYLKQLPAMFKPDIKRKKRKIPEYKSANTTEL